MRGSITTWRERAVRIVRRGGRARIFGPSIRRRARRGGPRRRDRRNVSIAPRVTIPRARDRRRAMRVQRDIYVRMRSQPCPRRAPPVRTRSRGVQSAFRARLGRIKIAARRRRAIRVRRGDCATRTRNGLLRARVQLARTPQRVIESSCATRVRSERTNRSPVRVSVKRVMLVSRVRRKGSRRPGNARVGRTAVTISKTKPSPSRYRIMHRIPTVTQL